MAPVDAFDFKTGQIVSLSPGLERGPAPHAEDIKENYWGSMSGDAGQAEAAPARVRRDVPGRSGKLVRPIVATLTILAIVEAAYLSIHLKRESRQSGKAESPQTTVTAADRSAAATSTSPVAPSARVQAESALVQRAVVDSRRANAEKNRDLARQPGPAATREQSAGIAAARPLLGWFSLSLPIQAQIFENEQFVGTSDGSRVMLPAGRHDLELVNESLRYRQWQSVEIRSGQSTSLAVVLPAGRLQVNAIPWSEVLIDGELVGETPLGDLRLPIGAHRVVFRHPQLGELTRTAVIAAGTSTRLSVNFNK
jgi:hypothetical protein